MPFRWSGLDCLILAGLVHIPWGQLADGLEAGWSRMTLDVILHAFASSLVD